MLEFFLKLLKRSPKEDYIFNPWWEVDIENEIDNNGPKIRRQQLSQYIEERIEKAKYLLIAEAIGYQGGHFTGIPMTSERILLGGQAKRGILPEHVFTGIKAKRTSKPELKPLGFSEPTATIVWKHIIQSNLNPKDFVLWNAFPWHPFKPESGRLSNRTPFFKDFQSGIDILSELIQITKIKNIIAVGNKSFTSINQLGIKSKKIRHPANGGARAYKQQFDNVIRDFKKIMVV